MKKRLRDLWRLWFGAPESVYEQRLRVWFPAVWEKRQPKR